MAVKNLRQRLVAFVAGLLLGPAVVWGGLESGTYISDLVATNPLGSDLASTLDDHLRLLKSTIKTTFPNINGAVTVTDEQINSVVGNGVVAGANPSASVGLTGVNGVATTYLRSDGAPALSQSIAPTWSGIHTFSTTVNFDGAVDFDGATNFDAASTFTTLRSSNTYAVDLNSNSPALRWRELDGAANNESWYMTVVGEQWRFLVGNDADNTSGTIMTVDRTDTTLDTVSFPIDETGGNAGLVVGAVGTVLNGSRLHARSARAGLGAGQFNNVSNGTDTVYIQNEDTSGNNKLVNFRTEGGSGTERGSIDFNRAGTAVRYNTTSDERLKKNFKTAPSARAFINAIPIESFDWRETGAHVEHGFVAQHLYKIAPDCVSHSKDPKAVWAVEKACLVPALIKYVQEQDARIARLEADAARRH